MSEIPVGLDERIGSAMEAIGFSKSAEQPRSVHLLANKPHVFARQYESGSAKFVATVTVNDILRHGETDILERLVRGAQRARGN